MGSQLYHIIYVILYILRVYIGISIEVYVSVANYFKLFESISNIWDDH